MNIKSKAKVLVVLGSIDEAEVFLTKYGREINGRTDNITIISFHPVVKSYLLKLKIKIVDSFRFCPTKSHQNLICVLEEFTEQVRENCHLRDRVGVEKSYVENLIFSLRPILSHWLYRAEVISNAVKCYEPEAMVCVGAEQPDLAQSFYIEASENCIANVASQVCTKWGVVPEKLPLGLGPKGLGPKTAKWTKTKEMFVNINILDRLLLWAVRPSERLVIAPSVSFQMDKVLSDLKRELGNEYALAVIKQSYKKVLSSIYNRYVNGNKQAYMCLHWQTHRKVEADDDFIEQKESLRKIFYRLAENWEYRKVYLSPWLKEKYRYELEPGVIDTTYTFSMNLNSYLDKWKPCFVLSQFARDESAVLIELCNLKDIPTMMIPHGSFTPMFDRYSKKEWKENALGIINTACKYVAIQTPLTKKFLSESPIQSIPIITGPLLFGRRSVYTNKAMELRRSYARDGEKIILHAGTAKFDPRFVTYETLDEYIDGMVSLIEAVDKMANVHLIIRFRPTAGLGLEELRKILARSTSYSIAGGGNFIDYLAISDLLVSFSSTTIEEALQNDIPVLIYNKYDRYQHIRGTELSAESTSLSLSPVYNVNSERNLGFGLKWVVDNHLSRIKDNKQLYEKYKYEEKDTVKLYEFIASVVHSNHRNGQ